MDELQQLLQEVQQLIANKEYETADKKLPDAILEKYNNAELYYEKAKVCFNLKQYNDGIKYATRNIDLDKNSANAYNILGNNYFRINDITKAEENYKKALQIDSKFVHAYNNLGLTYKKTKDYIKAEENYKKALVIDPNYANAHYNLGVYYEDMGDLEMAIKSFQKWLEIVKDPDDSVKKYIENKIEEIQKQLDNKDYNEISKLVEEVKNLLIYDGKSITHYTSLSVSRLLILESSPIRISEAAFLNDTSEGTALFDFLDINNENSRHNKKAQDYIPFVIKPFIGSFVADNKCNDLTLWRMYGKENNEEAKGCAITIDATTFLATVKQDLLSTNGEAQSIEDEFKLYHVAYISNNQDFVVPNNKTASNKLRKLLIRIRTYINNFLEKQPSLQKQQDMRELLNRIAYLFKNAEYQYEHEVRLIVKDVRLKRVIEKTDAKGNPIALPRVFIELININPYISKITIGPKVANKEEWASIFYYHLQEKQANKNLEIQVSCLPFK